MRNRTPSGPNSVNRGTAMAPSFITPNRRHVECQRWLQHDRDAIARRDALFGEPVGTARRFVGDGSEADRLVMPVGMRDADRDAVRISRMPVDAFVRDVQPLAIAVEQFPQPRGCEVALRIRIAGVIGEQRHASYVGFRFQPSQSHTP